MNDLADHVQASIRARRLLRDGQPVLVAVSGGVDSMVLLHLLKGISKSHHWKIIVAHFNHQLRSAQSDADEELVVKTARKLRLPVKAGRGDVGGAAEVGGISVEMAARKLRHDFLAATAVKLKISTIAVAHHADDQVELFFLRLLRGAGGVGLAGMKWSNPSPGNAKIRLARPLLDVPKADLETFAKENGITFSEDATNACVDIRRNRVRHELIPLLARHYQPALGGVILRAMDVVGAEAEYVSQTAVDWLAGGRRPDFQQLSIAVQRRVIHQQLTGRGLSPDFDLVERLRLGEGLWIDVDAGHSVLRERGGWVRIRRLEPLEFSGRRRELSLTGRRREITFGGLKIRWELAVDNGTGNACQSKNVEYFDADKVGAPVWLRRWQPGDRFQPIGLGSAKKLQDLFTNLKVPASERRQRVVAATGQGELFWVEGLRMAEKFKLDENTARKLKWSWRRG